MGDPIEEGVPGVKKTRVDSVLPEVGKRMTLLFDCGDEWLFDVELTAKARAEPRAEYPRLLRQGGKTQEQYPQYPNGGLMDPG